MASNQRIITAIVGWAVAFGIIALAPLEIFNIVVSLTGVLSFNELLCIYKVNKEPVLYYVALTAFIGVYIAFLFSPQRNLIEASVVIAPLIVFLSALAIPKDRKEIFEQATKAIFSGMYVAFLFCIIMLRFMPTGKELVFILCVGTWGRDFATYIFGRTIKRGHIILPRISPRKTYEGAICGLLFTVLTVILSAQQFLPAWRLVDMLVIGTGIGILGQIGDLVESWLKRTAQVDDSSHILPGQGGILDSFDSFIFTAPAMYLYVVFVLTK